ncbi:MAG: amidohydrolase [Bacteroidales bacterium]|nr:amidohydrolase [Bacteroidales bacterium]
MKILIKDVLLNQSETDILIKDNIFYRIGKSEEPVEADLIINGKDKAILPPFYNLHCHAGMNILRGYVEDLPLFEWLQRIWKREAELTAEDIYNGTRLAILEMIKSGTVFFADMYWFHHSILKAVEEMGIRANIGVCLMDNLGQETLDKNFAFLNEYAHYGNPLITFAPAPHAIYTCSGVLYKRAFECAERNSMFMQTHLSETVSEVEDCKKQHSNKTPVEYLRDLGVLSERTIAAHCVHFNVNDAEIFAECKSVAVHNPCSNMKLSSGIFNMPLMKEKHCKIALGTDGCSSNNNLSMTEEMKFACLLAKVGFQSADALKAEEVFEIATKAGAEYYGIKAGEIKEGMFADCILVDLNNEKMQPNGNVIYNMVYSADSSCIDTLICNGKVLMEHHKVRNEEEIIERAKYYAKH